MVNGFRGSYILRCVYTHRGMMKKETYHRRWRRRAFLMYLLTKEQIIPTLLLLLSRHSTLFLLLVVSSNASDWGCLTLVRETWGREIQNGRRLTVFWCRPCEFSLPNNRKSAFFVFSPLLIPIGVTSRSCRQQQQQWRCFIQSGSLVYSWPVLTQEEGKRVSSVLV